VLGYHLSPAWTPPANTAPGPPLAGALTVDTISVNTDATTHTTDEA
jgi:hypothetical protein